MSFIKIIEPGVSRGAGLFAGLRSPGTGETGPELPLSTEGIVWYQRGPAAVGACSQVYVVEGQFPLAVDDTWIRVDLAGRYMYLGAPDGSAPFPPNLFLRFDGQEEILNGTLHDFYSLARWRSFEFRRRPLGFGAAVQYQLWISETAPFHVFHGGP